MLSTQEVIDVTKAGISQLIAKGYMNADDTTANLTALDDQYIVDLGEKIGVNDDGSFDTNTPADIMFRALASQIGKIVIDKRGYQAALPRLYVDTRDWAGLVSEFVNIDLSDVMIDEIWNPNGYINFNGEKRGQTTYTPEQGQAEGARIAAIEFGCYKPVVHAKLYKKAHGAMVALTTGREQFFSAFRSEAEYSSFISGLFNSVENTLQVKAELYALMTVSMAIAMSKANGNMISLRDEYDTITGTSHTSTSNVTLMNDVEFQRYAAKRIADVRDNLKRMTAAYNDHESVTFSAETEMIMLSQVLNSFKFGLRADTFHENLVGLGDNVQRVSSWQAVESATNQTAFNFDTASSISLSDAAAEYAGLQQGQGLLTGVIGVIYDRMAMGVNVDRRLVTRQYAASRDTVNTFWHNAINYFINSHFPVVSFTLDSLKT